jgi:hypothetical protein
MLTVKLFSACRPNWHKCHYENFWRMMESTNVNVSVQENTRKINCYDRKSKSRGKYTSKGFEHGCCFVNNLRSKVCNYPVASSCFNIPTECILEGWRAFFTQLHIQKIVIRRVFIMLVVWYRMYQFLCIKVTGWFFLYLLVVSVCNI